MTPKGVRAKGIFVCGGCGSEFVTAEADVKIGHTKSCGCYNRAVRNARLPNLKHGLSPKGRPDPTYTAWQQMNDRCYNPNANGYKNYGGRGITVDPSWRDCFEAFLSYMGRRPSSSHSLDRFPDVDGNYVPGNVRWATWTQQGQNRRNNVRFSFRGEMLTIAQIKEIVPINVDNETLRRRLKMGWEVETTFSTPLRKR